MKCARVLKRWCLRSLLHTCYVRFTFGCGQNRMFATALALNSKVLAVVILPFKTRGHFPKAFLQDFAVNCISSCRKETIPAHFVFRLFWRFTLCKLYCRVQWQAHSRSINCTFAERPTWEGVAWKNAKLKLCCRVAWTLQNWNKSRTKKKTSQSRGKEQTKWVYWTCGMFFLEEMRTWKSKSEDMQHKHSRDLALPSASVDWQATEMGRIISDLARVPRGFAFASVYGEPLNLDRRRTSDAIFDIYGREKMRNPNKLILKPKFKFWLSILYEWESP